MEASLGYWVGSGRLAWRGCIINSLGMVLLVGGPTSYWVILSSLLDGIRVQETCLDRGWWWLLEEDVAANIIFVTGMLGLIVGGIYFFKTVRPAFLVEKTGKRAVDEVIARYRRPGERVLVGRPRLVVDGKGYYQAVYVQGEGASVSVEPLLVREDGQVVEEEALARRLLLLGALALELGEPGQMAQRYELYRRMHALVRGLRKMLGQAPAVRETLARLEHGDEDPLWIWEGYPGMVADFERMEKAAKVFLGGVERILQDLEAFSEMSWRKGGPKMEALHWEEWEALAARLQAMAYWNEAPERMEAVEGSWEAVERLERWIEANGGKGVVSLRKWGRPLVAWVETWKAVLEANEEIKRRGGREKDFRWLDVSEKDLTAWRRRLAWVRQVDRQVGRKGQEAAA